MEQDTQTDPQLISGQSEMANFFLPTPQFASLHVTAGRFSLAEIKKRKVVLPAFLEVIDTKAPNTIMQQALVLLNLLHYYGSQEGLLNVEKYVVGVLGPIPSEYTIPMTSWREGSRCQRVIGMITQITYCSLHMPEVLKHRMSLHASSNSLQSGVGRRVRDTPKAWV